MQNILRIIAIVVVLFTASSVFAASELSVQESMQAREWEYSQIPVFEIILSLASTTMSDVLLEGKVVRDDGVEVSTFTDRALITSATSTLKQYGLSIPEWQAGYYYVVIKISSPDTDETVIRRTTFSLRPHVAPVWVYGGSGAAALIGIAMITYIIARRREKNLVAPSV